MLGVVGVDLPDCPTVEKERDSFPDFELAWSGHPQDDLHFSDIDFFLRLQRQAVDEHVFVAGVRVRHRAYAFGIQTIYGLRSRSTGKVRTQACKEHFFEKGYFAHNSYGEFTDLFDRTILFDADANETLCDVKVAQSEIVDAIIFVTNLRTIRCGGSEGVVSSLHSLAPRSRVVAFAGSAYGVLHRFGVWFKPRWLEVEHLFKLRWLADRNRACPRAVQDGVAAKAPSAALFIARLPHALLHYVSLFLP